MVYRYDINGLRAIAVIAVVLFHFKPEWMSGGFAGVDVFFVISGFLMTKIIFQRLENNAFSLLSFYKARIKRILPALIFLCLSMAILGWFYLFTEEYAILVQHILASLSFFSNTLYLDQAGYFNSISYENWLLHTWSLSVEWQFYLIYPVILLALSKIFTLQKIKYVILLAAIIGFFFNLFNSANNPDPAYYLLPYRVWEMLLGALAFLFPFKIQKLQQKIIEIIGLLLILSTFIFISGDNLWPGYLALLPVIGTFLVIQAQNNSIFTNNIFFQHIGRWSYSIYLWHWPIVVSIYYFALSEMYIYAGLGLSLVLGYLSYQFIEQFSVKKSIKLNSAYSILLLVSLSLLPLQSQAFSLTSRADKNAYVSYYQRENYLPSVIEGYSLQCDFFELSTRKAKQSTDESCISSDTGGLFIWGDSHAQALSYGLRKAFNNINITQITSSACRPLLVDDTQTQGEFNIACNRSNQKAMKEVVRIKPDVILLAQHTDHNKNDFLQIEQFIEANNLTAKIFLVGPVPQWKTNLPTIIARRYVDKEIKYINDNTFEKKLFSINNFLTQKYNSTKIQYISLIDELCNTEGCLAKVDDNSTPLLWDSNHLSLKGSEYVVNTILRDKLAPYL